MIKANNAIKMSRNCQNEIICVSINYLILMQYNNCLDSTNITT